MRKLHIKAELATPQHAAVVFFALSLDEQLYDMTDDSFKASALNTFSRTLELQSIASSNYSAGIAKEALLPFIEELESSISGDIALDKQQRQLCKLHIEEIRRNMAESDRIARGVSGLRTVIGDYFKSIIAAIRETIALRPDHKQALSHLASSFIVQAEFLGFPRRHTYHVAQNKLIKKLKYAEAFNPDDLLARFFDEFPTKTRKFDCILLTEGDFSRFTKLLKTFTLDISDTAPLWEGLRPEQKAFLASKTNLQKFLCLEDISAKSPAQAHKITSGLFEEFTSVARFFEHRQRFETSSLALVRDNTSNRIFRIHNDPDPMHCWVSHTAATEAELEQFAAVTHGGHFREQSAEKLRRALRLHQSALLSGEAENQLIDLWAALEGLVARPGRESQRLAYFSECLLPAVTLTYPEKLFVSAYRDLCRVATGANEKCKELPGTDSQFSKFVRTILCQEHQKHCEEFVKELIPHSLLINKIWRLAQNFGSRTATQTTLRRHREKVGWHIARIYHTRNSIMHSATAMPYLPTLVENLHVYLDTLIKSLQRTALLAEERLTIDGALQYLSIWERYRLHNITHDGAQNDAKPTDGDVWSIVFGDRLTLAPSQNMDPVLHGSA